MNTLHKARHRGTDGQNANGIHVFKYRPMFDTRRGNTRKLWWAATMAKLYMGWLRGGPEPQYPREPV